MFSHHTHFLRDYLSNRFSYFRLYFRVHQNQYVQGLNCLLLSKYADRQGTPFNRLPERIKINTQAINLTNFFHRLSHCLSGNDCECFFLFIIVFSSVVHIQVHKIPCITTQYNIIQAMHSNLIRFLESAKWHPVNPSNCMHNLDPTHCRSRLFHCLVWISSIIGLE